MIRCRNCSHEEIEGALFCSECGGRLNVEDRLERKTTPTPPPEKLTETLEPPGDFEQTIPPDTHPSDGDLRSFRMQVLDLGEEITFDGKEDFTLGRASEGQPLIPEIDLNAYNAYEQGVSRMHAVISIRNNRVTITDLGSANGTWVNGDRVSPHTARVLNHGDLITLGKFRLQAILRN